MTANSWLAIDVGTAPMVRAQEVRFAWERFVEELERSGSDDEGDPELVRTAIADSWRRSFAAGVEPTGNRLAPIVSDEDETHAHWEHHPLARAAPLIRDCLAETAEEGGYLIVISDANGVLLCIEGNPAIRLRAEEVMNFAEGTLWSEPGAGTNAIGTAVAVDHAVQVFGPEHFHEPVQRWVCSAAPIHDPDTGSLLGVIDLTGDYRTVHPASLAVATATAAAVEGALQLTMQERDARLRDRYGDEVLRSPGTSALVAPSGRAITRLPPVWGAIERLMIPPGGGELMLPSGAHAVADPVGHAPEAFVVRTVDRRPKGQARPLLKLSVLGRDRAVLEIDDRRDRAAPAARRDPRAAVREPARHERRGAVRGPARRRRPRLGRARRGVAAAQAARPVDRHRPLPPHLRRRDRLAADRGPAGERAPCARRPRRTPARCCPARRPPASSASASTWTTGCARPCSPSDDPDAVWAWVNSPSGEQDVGAWKRLLSQLDFRDPRRRLCAARVAELRRLFGG